MISEIKSRLVKGKKSLWNFSFPSKVCGRPATLGGLGDHAVTLKLSPSKNYPHLDIKAFLNWNSYDDWTDEEKALVQALINELDSPSSSSSSSCTGKCEGCDNFYNCHDIF